MAHSVLLRLFGFELAGDAKVGDLDLAALCSKEEKQSDELPNGQQDRKEHSAPPLIEQNVVGLDVAMNLTIVVHVAQAFGRELHDRCDFPLRIEKRSTLAQRNTEHRAVRARAREPTNLVEHVRPADAHEIVDRA